MDYTNYTKEDWDKLDGFSWSYLLRDQPQFAKHCDWNKLVNKWDWRCLLEKQPQFAKYCDWSKMEEEYDKID